MAKHSKLIEALAATSDPDEVAALIANAGDELVKKSGLKVIGYAWERDSKQAPYGFSHFRERLPKNAGAIELWARA